MSITSIVFEVVLVLGVTLAIAYGVVVTLHLRRIPPVPSAALAAADANSDDPSLDQPTYWSRGEAFEEQWQGSRGYDRAPNPMFDSSGALRPGQNWTDALVTPVLSPLRPSRFNDPGYWRSYLPKVLVTWLVLFIGIPVVVAVINQTQVGAIAPFVPGALQREVPSHGSSFAQPVSCPTTTRSNPTGPSSSAAVKVAYSDDGKVVNVHPDGELSVRYLYGNPVTSPGAPLCLDQAQSTPGQAVFTAGPSGTGYLYLPQPNGARVVKIQVVAHDVPVNLLLLVVALVAVVVDIVLTRKLRELVTSR
jgi:hypothetical protein